MPQGAKKNAIERRLDELSVLWNEFVANPKARLLRCLADADNYSLVDTFVETQRQGGGHIPDLFVRFELEFDDPQTYAGTLLDDLNAQFDVVKTELLQSGLDSSWTNPAVIPGEQDIKRLLRASASLAAHYQENLEHVVLTITPKSDFNRVAWRQWLLELVRAEIPDSVRVVVLDQSERPVLDELCSAEPERVATIKVDLDMPGAYDELVRDVKGVGPGFTFRRLFVALTNAAGKKDLAAAQQLSSSALSIATQQNWPQMQVVVHMALGAAYLAAAKFYEALNCYRSASQAAEAAVSAGDEVGQKLLLPPRFAEGAALISSGNYAEAAVIYEATAPIAIEVKDPLMTFEAWRMAAYCHEMNRQIEPAWNSGQKALEAGAALDAELRPKSMLPFLGQMLLRLTKHWSYRKEVDGIRQRMNELAGPDWEARAVP